MAGLVFVVSAPSGAGKTSLCRELVHVVPSLMISVSHTTRPKRPHEEDGVHYHFVDHATFDAMIRRGDFLEYADVFGHRYGTSRQELVRAASEDKDLILELDWQGARSVRAWMPESLLIFILPPSLSALSTRLKQRAQDSDRVIEERLSKARSEVGHAMMYDFIVVNEVFEQALSDVRSIVRASRLRTRPELSPSVQQLLHALSATEEPR